MALSQISETSMISPRSQHRRTLLQHFESPRNSEASPGKMLPIESSILNAYVEDAEEVVGDLAARNWKSSWSERPDAAGCQPGIRPRRGTATWPRRLGLQGWGLVEGWYWLEPDRPGWSLVTPPAPGPSYQAPDRTGGGPGTASPPHTHQQHALSAVWRHCMTHPMRAFWWRPRKMQAPGRAQRCRRTAAAAPPPPDPQAARAERPTPTRPVRRAAPRRPSPPQRSERTAQSAVRLSHVTIVVVRASFLTLDILC